MAELVDLPAAGRRAGLKIQRMIKRFFIYVLFSEMHKQLYIGQTNNLERRFEQHNQGRVNSTKPYRPYKLIYFEQVDSKTKAIKREKELKLTGGRRFLKQFIK